MKKINLYILLIVIFKHGIKNVKQNYQLDKPKGVMGRNSDNTLIRSQLKWEPKFTLHQGLEKTYEWIFSEMKKKHNK